MSKTRYFQGWLVLLLALSISLPALAAPPCKGPNKNDEGCPGAEEQPPPEAVVESVTVDWFNQVIVVRGSGFAESTVFLLGGNATELATANVTDTELELVFDANLASTVDLPGSYNLLVDGAVALSIYIESAIVDPAATGCPCEAGWASEAAINWGSPATECLEIVGPGTNDIADISGEVLVNPGDATEFPHYFVGASFYPGVPADSYCALIQLNADTTTADLVRFPINENQQVTCAVALETNVCSSVTTLP